MKTPKGLQPLIDDGIVDEVIRALKSGKEASVYIVRCGAQIRCAKVYKDMGQRSFQARAQYQEGRKVRGSRQARAMAKSTRYGRREQESEWKNTEVECAVPAGGGRRAGAEALRLFQRRAGDGNGHRCRGSLGAAPR